MNVGYGLEVIRGYSNLAGWLSVDGIRQ